MGFFAVLQSDGKPAPIVRKAHVNLWCLPGLFRTVVIVDIGLHVSRGTDPASEHAGHPPSSGRNSGHDIEFELFLPFSTEPDTAEDLSSRSGTGQIRLLLFGPAAGTKDNTVSYGGTDIPILPVSLSPVKAEGEKVRDRMTTWKVKVHLPASATDSCYVRCRFVARDVSRLLITKYSALTQTRIGMLVDFRSCDMRGIAEYESVRSLESRMCTIEDSRLFLIAPGELALEQSSPPIYYARVFEGRLWVDYLGRAASLFGSRRFIVYQWKAPDTKPINVENPSRVFATFQRDTATLVTIAVLRIAVVVAVVLGCLYVAGNASAATWVSGMFDAGWKKGVALAAPLIPFVTMLRHLKWMTKWINPWSAKWVRSSERAIYSAAGGVQKWFRA